MGFEVLHCLFSTYIKSAKAVAFLWHLAPAISYLGQELSRSSVTLMSDFVQLFPIFIFDWVVYAFNLLVVFGGRE